MQVSPEEERQRGLTRERLVDSALELINEEGLEGLSMRALADRLEVKASSLYWHVRDRGELLELLAESILERVGRPRRSGAWRQSVLAIGAALGTSVNAQKDADRILLEVPEALERSDTFADLKSQLQAAGLQAAETGDGPGASRCRLRPGTRSSISAGSTCVGSTSTAAPRTCSAFFQNPEAWCRSTSRAAWSTSRSSGHAEPRSSSTSTPER